MELALKTNREIPSIWPPIEVCRQCWTRSPNLRRSPCDPSTGSQRLPNEQRYRMHCQLNLAWFHASRAPGTRKSRRRSGNLWRDFIGGQRPPKYLHFLCQDYAKNYLHKQFLPITWTDLGRFAPSAPPFQTPHADNMNIITASASIQYAC